MRSFLVSLATLLVATPASAVILITDNADVFAIGPGDVFDHVFMLENSQITMTGGTVIGHFLMLDSSLATFSGGTVGSLDVFGASFATVVIQPGTLVLDGLPTPEPVLLEDANCASCTVAATLANGDPVGPVPVAALQTGQVEIVAVPEPNPGMLMGLGLFGLGMAGRKLRPC